MLSRFQATTYGRCIAEKAERIKHRDCDKEFTELITCFKKQVVSAFSDMGQPTYSSALIALFQRDKATRTRR
jgi:hypothetical protein